MWAPADQRLCICMLGWHCPLQYDIRSAVASCMRRECMLPPLVALVSAYAMMAVGCGLLGCMQPGQFTGAHTALPQELT